METGGILHDSSTFVPELLPSPSSLLNPAPHDRQFPFRSSSRYKQSSCCKILNQMITIFLIQFKLRLSKYKIYKNKIQLYLLCIKKKKKMIMLWI